MQLLRVPMLVLVLLVHAGAVHAEPDPLPTGALRRWGGSRLRHGKQVLSLAFSPDGKRLASSSFDHSIRLWAVPGGALVRVLEHRGVVSGIAFSPDGTQLAAACRDKHVYLWDVASGALIRRLTGHEAEVMAVAFSPDGTRLASRSDRELLVHDCRSGERVARHRRTLKAFCFALDGDRIYGASQGQIGRLDVATGRWEALSRPRVHGRYLTALVRTHDGKALYSTGEDGLLRGWSTGPLAPRFQRRAHTESVHAVAVFPDDKRLATCSEDGRVLIWDAAHGRQLAELTAGSRLFAVAISPDGGLVASAGWDGVIFLWRLPEGRLAVPQPGLRSRVHNIGVTPDGELLACAGAEQAVHLWSARTGRHLRRLHADATRAQALAVSPDGKHLATGGYKGQLRLWSLPDGAPGATAQVGWINQVRFHPNGTQLAVGAYDGTLSLYDIAGLRRRYRVEASEGGSSEIQQVRFSPDGRLIAAGSRRVALFESATGSRVARFERKHKYWVGQLAFAPDGKTIASASIYEPALFLWDVPSGRVRQLALRTQERIGALLFTADGKYLIIGLRDGKLTWWDLAADAPRYGRSDGHGVTALALHPDGKRIVSGSAAGYVLLWSDPRAAPGK